MDVKCLNNPLLPITRDHCSNFSFLPIYAAVSVPCMHRNTIIGINEAKDFVKRMCQTMLPQVEKEEASNFAEKTVYLLGGRFLHLYHMVMHVDVSEVRSLADLEQIVNKVNMYRELTTDEGMTHFELAFNKCPNFKKLYDCFRDGK